MQPYRKGSQYYESQDVQGVKVTWRNEHAVVEWEETADVWSSAVFHGGHAQATKIVNHMVGKGFDCSDPVGYMELKCKEWGYDAKQTVGLLTAARMTHLSVEGLEGDQFSLFCATTAGTSNAARAGMKRETYSSYLTLDENLERKDSLAKAQDHKDDKFSGMIPGTINTIIVIEARIQEAAVLNLLQSAVEAKAAALADLNIRDRETGLIATGTTTDTVAIAILDRGRYTAEHQYGGTATTIGNELGMLVYNTVSESVRTQFEDDNDAV
ncbi:adenosylcobinamide amidohydrolase [Paenibacillus sp. UMB4589-SE434]|uniref:adenosylcobinamide amidohydrolase n=1 Tax=Paenibacillus sp. UMB4589-SE434 TaxID=3046314 RepID=UPI002549D243|nr:adenosylcobinamide amidohydrolase [Paenibacillus sp. UMB4589-SE434]MDK8182953.1 adenosylcobinamide amidohydrolase [Paenibacillus sp. UMB4589-SE434]